MICFCQDPDKASAMGQDFPGFYTPRATVVDTIVKPIGNGDLLPGLQIPGSWIQKRAVSR
jgi:hypothetical protein